MYFYFAEALRIEQIQIRSLCKSNKSHNIIQKPQNNQKNIQQQQPIVSNEKENIKIQQPKQISQHHPQQPVLSTQYHQQLQQTVVPAAPLEEYSNQPVVLKECPQGCGRKFNESSLVKHMKICKKVFQQTREAFDSKVQREAEGLDDIDTYKPHKNSKQATKKKEKVNWKEQSEAFRMVLQHSRNPDEVLTPKEQELMKKATTPSDFVQCEYCQRKFNEGAAIKHIPFCKQQAMKKAKK